MRNFLGDTADPDSDAFKRAAILAAQPTRAPSAIDLQLASDYKMFLPRKAELQKTVSAPYTVAGPVLTPIGKQFQELVIARDWDKLFAFLPAKEWGQYGMLGKYSFVDQNGTRTYIPFTEDQIRRFVYSKHYTIQPGHECTDEQRAMGVAALVKAGKTHSAKFPTTDWKSIWPIYPGWGYPGQRYGCEKYVPSTWVKIRKPVAIAVGAVALAYLGPIVYGKISGAITGAATEGGTAGIVGAGTKAGSLATTAATTTAQQASIFTQVKTATAGILTQVNRARTIEAIANGEIPPPPIGITGDSFTEWSMDAAKKELMSQGGEYYQKKMTKEAEAQLRAEILAMQNELNRLVPANTPKSPSDQVPAIVQQKSAELAISEKQSQNVIAALLAIAGTYILMG